MVKMFSAYVMIDSPNLALKLSKKLVKPYETKFQIIIENCETILNPKSTYDKYQFNSRKNLEETPI